MSEQMREEFEAWAISRRFAVDRDPYLRGGPYTSVWTTGAWEAWQAALATQPQAPGPDPVLVHEPITEEMFAAFTDATGCDVWSLLTEGHKAGIRQGLTKSYLAMMAVAHKTQAPQGAVTGWVNIDERLPESGVRVLVMLNDPEDTGWVVTTPWIALYMNGYWHDCDAIMDGCEITHWMPLPAAPETPEGRS